MKTKMKLNRSGLFLAICLALTVFASTVPAEARSATGWGAWKLHRTGIADNWCINEAGGAVINNCTHTVELGFNMEIDAGGYRDVYVTGAKTGSYFTCALYSSRNGQVEYEDWAQVYPAGQTFFRVWVNSGGAILLVCYDMQPNSGVASLNWTYN